MKKLRNFLKKLLASFIPIGSEEYKNRYEKVTEEKIIEAAKLLASV